jgi:predicted nucleic acid-binding protein
MEFLDTNIIIRYVTQDNPDQASRAYHLLQQLDAGTRTLMTTEGVLIEVVQVLSSRVLYNLPRDEIKTHLSAIIPLRGLKLQHKRTYLRALDLYVLFPHLDFVDALNVAHMERTKISSIVTFDRDFDRVPGITRQEP